MMHTLENKAQGISPSSRGGLESLNWLGWNFFSSHETWLIVLKPRSHLCSKLQTITVNFGIGPHDDFTGKCQPSTHIIKTVKIKKIPG